MLSDKMVSKSLHFWLLILGTGKSMHTKIFVFDYLHYNGLDWSNWFPFTFCRYFQCLSHSFVKSFVLDCFFKFQYFLSKITTVIVLIFSYVRLRKKTSSFKYRNTYRYTICFIYFCKCSAHWDVIHFEGVFFLI
jgi:hypothetical protein